MVDSANPKNPIIMHPTSLGFFKLKAKRNAKDIRAARAGNIHIGSSFAKSQIIKNKGKISEDAVTGSPR